ncbi:MAG: TetR/AcrR family transcriptional regulator [Erysipelotrichaceae bacterium]
METIVKATLALIQEEGLTFTMDQLAKKLGISKRTLYEKVASKENLLEACIELYFQEVKRLEKALLNDLTLQPIERLAQMVICQPALFEQFQVSQLLQLQQEYPSLYQKVLTRLDEDWETTFDMLAQAQAANQVRPISYPIFKMMVVGSFHQFLQHDLHVYHLNYQQALQQMMEILLVGIQEEKNAYHLQSKL